MASYCASWTGELLCRDLDLLFFEGDIISQFFNVALDQRQVRVELRDVIIQIFLLVLEIGFDAVQVADIGLNALAFLFLFRDLRLALLDALLGRLVGPDVHGRDRCRHNGGHEKQCAEYGTPYPHPF